MKQAISMSDADEVKDEKDDGEPAELVPHIAPIVAEVYRHDPITGVELLFAAGRRFQAKRAPSGPGRTPTPVPIRNHQPPGLEPARKDETCASAPEGTAPPAEGDGQVEPDPYEAAGAERARRKLARSAIDK